METIIHQITVKMVEEILKAIEKVGISRIGETAKTLQKVINAYALEILSTVIARTDAALIDAKKERRKDGITVHERNVKRTVLTELGELEYKRTYFKLKDGMFICLTDQIIGVEPFERITKELCAELVQNAASMSMQKAADAVNASVSRQTVNNKVLAVHQLAADAERVQNTPETLHIFADEDHVHMRPKKCSQVPLVTVTEGIDMSDPKRHKTINPMHFQGFGINNEDFCSNVSAAVSERYDMDKVRKIFIHADGGQWIKRLGTYFPNATFAMDGFHLQKYCNKLFKRCILLTS